MEQKQRKKKSFEVHLDTWDTIYWKGKVRKSDQFTL